LLYIRKDKIIVFSIIGVLVILLGVIIGLIPTYLPKSVPIAAGNYKLKILEFFLHQFIIFREKIKGKKFI
jgi:hypothetical protein